ncbi:hypothetical protein ACHAW5_005440 [Stephanodiscus triporus]|uniref:Secreted protein n=1 Tax=Stephanodiscus triporus TaxID=2934178 RepID=A0ABD3NR05_9STRA
MRLLPSTSIVVAVAAVVLVVSAPLAPCTASDAPRHDDVVVAVGDAEPEEGAPDNDGRREEGRYHHVDPLHDMSDEELEGICSRRGFELSPPTSDGNNSYSHEDYVDAAMECLRIESDM